MSYERRVLLVATNDYRDPRLATLRAAADDLPRLAGVLGDPAIGGFSVESAVNQSAVTINEPVDALFLHAESTDFLLLYFSGHGVRSSDGSLYLAASDTRLDRLRSTALPARFVTEVISDSRATRILVLLDCSFSGHFITNVNPRTGHVAAGEGLGGTGLAVITASGAIEYAYEGDEQDSRGSAFTRAVVEALSSGAADLNGDGLISVDELYAYIYDQVTGDTPGQTPQMMASGAGELIVARSPTVSKVRRLGSLHAVDCALTNSLQSVRLAGVQELLHLLEFASGDPDYLEPVRERLIRMVQDPSQAVSTVARDGLARVTPTAAPQESSKVLIERAAELARQNEFPAAEEMYRRLMQSDDMTTVETPQLALAYLLARTDRRGAAAELARSLAERVGWSPPPEDALFVGQLLVGSPTYSEAARTALEKALDSQLPAGRCSALRALGRVDQNSDDYDSAITRYQDAAGIGDPEESPKAWFDRAEALAVKDRVADAEKAYQEAVDSHHRQVAPWAALRIGNLLEERNDFRTAARAYLRDGSAKSRPKSCSECD